MFFFVKYGAFSLYFTNTCEVILFQKDVRMMTLPEKFCGSQSKYVLHNKKDLYFLSNNKEILWYKLPLLIDAALKGTKYVPAAISHSEINNFAFTTKRLVLLCGFSRIEVHNQSSGETTGKPRFTSLY